MKKEGVLLVAVIVLGAAGFCQAQEGELSGSVGLTYVSEYIWRGFDYFLSDRSAYQANAAIDLGETGLGLNLSWIRPFSSGRENAETASVGLSYGSSVLEGETYVTSCTVGWVYYGFPDEPRSGGRPFPRGQGADMQEMFLSLAWPEICPAGIVPSYTVVMMWPSESGSRVNENQGWAHIFGIGYDFQIAGLMAETPEQTVHVSAAMVYNDGMMPGVAVQPLSGTTDHDWSHAVLGVSTDFDLGNELVLTPGFYYQSSWEDTVNPEDEYWVSLGLAYSF
ncbi:MAG: hypothetical protein ACYTEL_08155 [Planctomycetota bacterium]|jgi:hypothetical protein